MATESVSAAAAATAHRGPHDWQSAAYVRTWVAENEARLGERQKQFDLLADFIPPSYPLEIELQNLVAVQECTSRELLPEAFQKLDRGFVTQRIRELKLLLEER